MTVGPYLGQVGKNAQVVIDGCCWKRWRELAEIHVCQPWPKHQSKITLWSLAAKYSVNKIYFLVLKWYLFQHCKIYSEAIYLLTKINDSFIMASFISYLNHFGKLFMLLQYNIKDINQDIYAFHGLYRISGLTLKMLQLILFSYKKGKKSIP